MAFSEPIPNLINGVSQQPAATRMPTQAEEQINGYSSLVEGLSKRMPLQHVAALSGVTDDSVYIHTIDRDGEERYTVVLSDYNVQVFDAEGAEVSVAFEDDLTPFYLGLPDPSLAASAFSAVTLKDTTLLLNKTVEAVDDTFAHAARLRQFMIVVKGVNYDVGYKVIIDGVTIGTVTTIAADAGPRVTADEVASDIYDLLVADADPRFNVYKSKNTVILAQSVDGAEAKVSAYDDLNAGYIDVIDGETANFSDLPTRALVGFQTKITGTSADAKPYYLQFVGDAGGLGVEDGYWEEIAQPGVQSSLNRSTMPHELVRLGDGTFLYQRLVWGDRNAGDLNTAPWPSFVGKTLEDIYLDRNRLCLVHSEGVCMSRARALFEFFPTTVTTVLADGPIDVAPSGAGVANLRQALVFGQRVIFFGDGGQYVMNVDTLKATEPPAILYATAYNTSAQSAPIAVGNNVYFTTDVGGYTAVMEGSLTGDTLVSISADDTTRHVPKYIPVGGFKLAATSATDTMLLLTEGQRNAVFAYKFYWRGPEKLQSCWSRWEFGADAVILNVAFTRDVAEFVVRFDDGVYLMRMALAEGQEDGDAGFVFRLDRRVTEAACGVSYDAGTNTTEVTLPYVPGSGESVTLATRSTAGGRNLAARLPITDITGDVVTVSGDISGAEFYAGVDYNFLYEFSKPALKTQSRSGGMASSAGGRLQILKWFLSYVKTGSFKVTTETGNGAGYVRAYNGPPLSTGIGSLGAPSLADGVFGFRVNGKAERVRITIESDSYIPCSFVGAEWEAKFTRLGSR